ncbi:MULTISPECIES: DUF1481 domain-containing protein [Salinivibrio]|uniref:DUF1481 domain-containing protein n=1 Tax=Salinivibrio kushneri TaxID=1908198 RepID=A0AB36K2I9_9GAMM|nr:MULTISPECIES: DUF1481 domain-containing protein [Salinivibrio]ODP98485.1 hypothetical protein BGL48_11430 [Salinivibrio sp. BNH]OOE33353.1 hypothetical protein BZG05_11170 [Salinivibrio kushneri]OOE42022.1 hypothetical protein BZG09_14960 [Salinivibrio kushneri]OOE42572.1 hypothetical protein BZG06_12755 [Salinivibrio kushneri]OOE52269.1 hypothetical protein BZG11_05030 [Salinivibrio kushneri]
MRFHLCILALVMALTGCSSGKPPKPVTHTTAFAAGDYRAVYWLDSQQGQVIGLAERAWQGDYGQYRSEYAWRAGSLRALKREGKKRVDNRLVPFSMHVRFDANGEPVFQRYHQGDALLPLDSATLSRLYQEANHIERQAQAQLANNVSVLQAQRQGEHWVDCDGDRQRWALPETMTPSLVQRINQPGTFVIAGGSPSIGRDQIDFLVHVEGEKRCLQRPRLLDE